VCRCPRPDQINSRTSEVLDWVERTTTSVAQLLNLKALLEGHHGPVGSSLTDILRRDHTVFSSLKLCDEEVETRSLASKYLKDDVNRSGDQFLLLNPESTTFPGCDIIIAAPTEAGENFFIVFECKMTKDPAKSETLTPSKIADKFYKCLRYHDVLFDAFMAGRLCYLVGGMRRVTSELLADTLCAKLRGETQSEKPPETAGAGAPVQRTRSARRKDTPKKPPTTTTSGKQVAIRNTSQASSTPPKQTKKEKAVRQEILSCDSSHLRVLCERSVLALGREAWREILTPTLACRPQWSSEFY